MAGYLRPSGRGGEVFVEDKRCALRPPSPLPLWLRSRPGETAVGRRGAEGTRTMGLESPRRPACPLASPGAGWALLAPVTQFDLETSLLTTEVCPREKHAYAQSVSVTDLP